LVAHDRADGCKETEAEDKVQSELFSGRALDGEKHFDGEGEDPDIHYDVEGRCDWRFISGPIRMKERADLQE
jgi:hypothetical protein